MNVPPGAFRVWLGRIAWGLVLLIPLTGLLLVLLMLSAESRALDHSRTVGMAAQSILASGMRAFDPESVPGAIHALSVSTGSRVVLLREDGTPAYSDTRALDHLKAYVQIPDSWRKAAHSPELFLWPPPGVPGRLPHEVDRVFSQHFAGIVANKAGQASPLAMDGGFAAIVEAIPNRPSCARCHGFDKEVLGHWVVISRVEPVANREGVLLWGFWPLALINQKFLLGSTLALAVSSVFFVSILETWSIRRGYKAMMPRKASSGKGKKKEEGREESPGGGQPDLPALQEEATQSDWQELSRRIDILDQSILALVNEVPRSGILQGTPEKEAVAVRVALSSDLADWSDRFEMALQDLESLPATTDPVFLRFLERARELRAQAISYADTAASEPREETSGPLKAPFFEALTEDQKEWTDRLRAVLGHLHAEIRAMAGVAKAGVSRTDSFKDAPPASVSKSPPPAPK